MKLKLLISYSGTRYAGWQIQENSPIHLPTIQGEVESAFSKLYKEPIRVLGASRTDSGVHADEQCAHCKVPYYPKNIVWLQALNTLLPEDIRIKDVQLVDDNFHSRYNSVGKVYTYTIWTDRNYISPRLSPYAWTCGKVDFSRIEACIPHFTGTHDFKSFQNVGTELHTTERTIFEIKLEHVSEHQCDIIISGNGFLKQMVRNLIGLFVYIGRGKISPQEGIDILHKKYRNSIFPTAPAHGLTLSKVLYE